MTAMQKVLIVLLSVASLTPSMFLGEGAIRYVPPFAVLFLLALYGGLSLRKAEYRVHFRAFTSKHTLLLCLVGLYLIAIWSVSLSRLPADLTVVAGITIVLVICHLFLPLLVRTRQEFVFVARTVFFTCLIACLAALVFLAINRLTGASYGIYKVKWLTAKLRFLPKIKITVIRGIFSNPNSFAMLIAMGLPSLMFLIREEERPLYRLLLGGAGLLCFITLLQTFSRTALLSAVVALFMSLLFLTGRHLLAVAKALVAFLLLGFPVVIIFGIDMDFMKVKMVPTDRIALWSNATELIRQHPLTGLGIQAVQETLTKSAHNTFIETAAAFGLIAMGIYTAYLIVFLVKLQPGEDRAAMLYALLTLAAFSILQCFETLIFGGMSISNFYTLIITLSYLSAGVSAEPSSC